jgi:DNA-binding LytR/AlgR family response regulator
MLAEMLKKIDGIKIAGEFEDAPSAISAIKKGEVDILFLDVEMPAMSGIELLRMIPKKPISILVSAKPAYAVEAFELNVVDFLVKPLSVPRVIAAVERAKELLTEKNTNINVLENVYVFIKDGKTIRKIEIQSILWLEAKGDYVKIATQKGNYVNQNLLIDPFYLST